MKNVLNQIKDIAKSHQWILIDHQANIGLLSFRKIINNSKARINVYYTTMTVATALKHPKKGKTQLYRRHVSFKLLEKIFTNPRIHTCKGYFERREL